MIDVASDTELDFDFLDAKKMIQYHITYWIQYLIKSLNTISSLMIWYDMKQGITYEKILYRDTMSYIKW